MSFCEEKNRLIVAHAGIVNRYDALVEKRHNGHDGLSEEARSMLAAEIRDARTDIDAARLALDSHICEHGCGTVATKARSTRG